jgi:hypothetical protein
MWFIHEVILSPPMGQKLANFYPKEGEPSGRGEPSRSTLVHGRLNLLLGAKNFLVKSGQGFKKLRISTVKLTCRLGIEPNGHQIPRFHGKYSYNTDHSENPERPNSPNVLLKSQCCWWVGFFVSVNLSVSQGN